jgi:Tfp pilus assembly protein FimV
MSIGVPVMAQAQLILEPSPPPVTRVADPGGSRPVQQGAAGQGGWQYMVRSGDTLDKIIAQTQAASPFSLAFLRDAFAKLNPSALPRGPQGPLIAGSLLRVPDSAELRRIAFPELESSQPVSSQAASHPAHPPSLTAAQREELERRSWVRFP